MKRMLHIAILLTLTLIAGSSLAQQEALYSQYMHNPFIYNPAYAGSRNTISSTASYRSQWASVPGHPVTTTLNIHGPVKHEKMAVGLNIINDKLGAQSNFGALLTYAYQIRLGAGLLSFGLRGGIYRYQFDTGILNLEDNTDSDIATSLQVKTQSKVEFGLYYYTKSFYAGLAISNVTPITIEYNTNLSQSLNRHYFFHVGKAIEITDYLLVKPSFMIRYVAGAPVNYGITTKFLVKKLIWVGMSYRSSQDIALLLEINLKDFMRLGYSYDVLSASKSGFGGTNEIFLGIDINRNRNKIVSSRYL